ncbi:MAG TPA: orotate phosphoribosyltransferase [Steroidobacteraceae bacterium]|nr:orotate phosphoribosyltransferase [Steroidobacteraceae bacterium]
MLDHQLRFLRLALERQALRFGEFKLKSGRISPYFFNAGLFNDGASLVELGRCYAAALVRSGLAFDMLFGPAYKGIPLVSAAAIALAEAEGRNLPWAFNRKEAKDHGESGLIVGSPLQGRVVIVDDVITAGTAIRESVELIRRAGATPIAVALAMDRQERGQSQRSAVQEVEAEFGLKCVSILDLQALIEALTRTEHPALDANALSSLEKYRKEYGVDG